MYEEKFVSPFGVDGCSGSSCSACSEKKFEYTNVIPANASTVVSINMKSLVDKAATPLTHVSDEATRPFPAPVTGTRPATPGAPCRLSASTKSSQRVGVISQQRMPALSSPGKNKACASCSFAPRSTFFQYPAQRLADLQPSRRFTRAKCSNANSGKFSLSIDLQTISYFAYERIDLNTDGFSCRLLQINSYSTVCWQKLRCSSFAFCRMC